MMDCKNALAETCGDEDAAIELLRKRGARVMADRVGRETAFGRFGVYANLDPGVGAMVELRCESAPVSQNELFIRLANDLARQLAGGSGAATVEALLDQASPSNPRMTLREQKDELFNRIREVIRVGRMVRLDGPCGGYSHNAATVAGVLVEVEGGTPDAVKDVCMHVAAMRPTALSVEELDPALVAKEREILREAARKEGKPDNIIDKMVEGRLRGFYAETVLLEQPFVKEQKQTVGKFAQQQGMRIKRFVHWELGRD
jgi:elongation factor Ts